MRSNVVSRRSGSFVVALAACALALASASACDLRRMQRDREADGGGLAAATTTPATTPTAFEEPVPSAVPPAPAPAPAKAAAPRIFPATCAGYCEHALRCANSFVPEENEACLASCEQQHVTAAKLAQMNAMDCPGLLAAMGLGGRPAPKPAPASRPTVACSDCTGCYWEQDMCLYVHGYVATGLKEACKRCCCPGH